jgi:hypothetical protein
MDDGPGDVGYMAGEGHGLRVFGQTRNFIRGASSETR